MTPQCRELNLAFKKSEQAVSQRLIAKKARISNNYWGRVKDDGMFPLNRGTTIKGIRLGRMLVENEQGWSGVSEATYCSTDMCDQKVPDIIKNGFDDYTYSLASKQVRTDWFCLNDLAIREIPDEEIAHFEDGMRSAARYIWEEFLRSRYTNFCGNKLLAKLPNAVTDSTDKQMACQSSIVESAFIYELRPSPKAGVPEEIDENYIRVNCDPADLGQISELTFDMLDIASERLEYEDEAFFDDQIDLIDVVLAAKPMGKRMMEIENLDMDQAMSYGGYNISQLKRKLGTRFVARDTYSVRYDSHGARFYPDDDYNTNTLPAFGAFSATNPQTWPRFKRVYPYVPVQASVAGIKFVYNDDYRKAPFGISNVFSKRVIEMQHYPEIAGYGRVQKGDRGKMLSYAGSATWINPDWPCNEDREMGFFKLRFGAAIRPWMTEEGFSYFHRIDRRLSLASSPCTIEAAPCEEDVLAYCYAGTAGSGVADTENRPSAHHLYENGAGGWL